MSIDVESTGLLDGLTGEARAERAALIPWLLDQGIAGDWFGSPVNLASRLTSVARPGAVLVAEAARREIGDDLRFRWSSAGAKRLKNIAGEVRVYRARRAEAETASSPR